MNKEMNLIFSSILFISIVLVSCKSKKDEIIIVDNSSPQYIDEKYVELEKLYTIDVTQISMFSKESATDFGRVIDFDKNNNMYILDPYESKISVFNENGKLVRSFGRAGQGPKEFSNPNALVIKNNRIYVFESFTNYKIVDLNGDYISKQVIQIENRLRLKAVDDAFFLFRGKTDRTFTNLEFILTIEDDNFYKNKELFRYEYPPGLRGPNYDFGWHSWLLISDNGDFFFPEDNFGKYSITKHDKEGKSVLIFGREYTINEYSKEARDRFYKIYNKQIERGERVFPKSPPIVGNMFQDDKKNIWVIVGESFEDNGNPNYETTIDIFNDKGKWMYAFKSKLLSRFCFYNDGRIYRVLPINLDTYEQYIDVYKIRYRNSQ